MSKKFKDLWAFLMAVYDYEKEYRKAFEDFLNELDKEK